MNGERKPIFLLADSQSLFQDGSSTLLPALQESVRVAKRNLTRAAYIGASNGDAPEFFEIFVAAMDRINLHESRMIRSDFGAEDRAFLKSADLVLLAGGSVDDGWGVMTSTGMDLVITKKYHEGAVIVGVSAGAVQLGTGWHGTDSGGLQGGLTLVPYCIGVHGEQDDWSSLRNLVEAKEDYAKGFGISLGGAMIYHADRSFEAVGRPVVEFERSTRTKGRLVGNYLFPIGRKSSFAGALGCPEKRDSMEEGLS